MASLSVMNTLGFANGQLSMIGAESITVLALTGAGKSTPYIHLTSVFRGDLDCMSHWDISIVGDSATF